MKTIVAFALIMTASIGLSAQIDKDKLALDVSKAEAQNFEKLKPFIWKRTSVVSIDGQVKSTAITEFSFDEKGELQSKVIDAQSNVKKKPGLRGVAQESAVEDKADYVEKALKLSLAYTFMTKGQLLDFFSKAEVNEANGVITAKGSNVNVQGDELIIKIDAKTLQYIQKTFKSKLDKDPIDGVINYEPFSSGVVHGTTTILNLPAQNMRIDAKNGDYSQRVK
jgi:hypothetical protein